MTGIPLTSLIASTASNYSWNGPVCTTCGRGYIGEHECSEADLQARIDALQQRLDETRQRKDQP